MKIPTVFQTKILLRAIGEKEVEALAEKYASVRQVVVAKPISEQEIQMANLAKRLGVTDAAKHYGVFAHEVNTAIARVARHQFLGR